MSELFGLGRMAARLGVTQAWLRQKAEAGEVPCLQAGTRFLFNPVAVQEELAVQAARTRRRDRRRHTGPQNVSGAQELTIDAAVDSEAVQDESGPQAAVCVDEKGD